MKTNLLNKKYYIFVPNKGLRNIVRSGINIGNDTYFTNGP